MTSTNRITSYTDYLLALITGWPELSELYDFMRSRPQTSQASLMIIELTEDAILVERFSNRSGRWRDALHQRKESVRGRVCVLKHGIAESIDREMLDSCALLYDLDPFFILEHFASTKLKDDDFPRSRLVSTRMPSYKMDHNTILKVKYLEICSADNDSIAFILHMHLSTTAYRLPLFVVPDLERPSIHNEDSFQKDLSSGSIMQCYMAMLRSWTRAQIDLASTEPMLVLLPWLEFFAVEQKNQSFNVVEDWKRQKETLPFFEIEKFSYRSHLCGYLLHMFEETLYTVISDMNIWRGKLNTSSNFYAQLGRVIEDLQDTHALIRRAIDDFEIVKNDYGRTQSLIDSRDAAGRSRDSAALTSMAFFFIPISVVTSIFGMNVQELGSGTLPISQAFISAAVAVILAIFLWGISSTVSRRWSSFTARITAFQESNRSWRRFARVRPMLGFWLLIFFLTHDPSTSEPGLEYCGLDISSEWHIPRLISEDMRYYRSFLTPFWEDKLLQICDVTRVQGWDK